MLDILSIKIMQMVAGGPVVRMSDTINPKFANYSIAGNMPIVGESFYRVYIYKEYCVQNATTFLPG